MARRDHHLQRRSGGRGSQSPGDPGRAPREQPAGLPGHPADVQIPGPSSPSAGERAGAGRPLLAVGQHTPQAKAFLLPLPTFRGRCMCITKGAGVDLELTVPFCFFFSKEQIKSLEEEIQSLEEAESSLSSYSHWYSSTHKNFKNVAAKIDKVDKVMMGKKMKTLEVGMATSELSPNLPSFTELLLPLM